MGILSKYCRKCGAEQKHIHVKYTAAMYYVYCDRCNVKTDIYFTKEKAIEAWNCGKTKRTKI